METTKKGETMDLCTVHVMQVGLSFEDNDHEVLFHEEEDIITNRSQEGRTEEVL